MTYMADVYPVITEQLSSQLSPVVWSKLPQELIDTIAEYIRLNCCGKHGIAAVSMLSKHWMTAHRPFLFHELWIRNPSDLCYLRTILNSKTSGWLYKHIYLLIFEAFQTSGEGRWLAIPHPLSIKDLPYLSEIIFSPQRFDNGLVPDDSTAAWLPRIPRRSQKNCTASIRRVLISAHYTHSASSLIQVLGALPCLEEIKLTGVHWSTVSNSYTFPKCRASFSSIRDITMEDCTDNWPAFWIFAAASIGHNFRFPTHNDDNEADIPKDVMIVAKVLDMFTLGPRLRIHKQRSSDAGK